jgi:hypothetical protein
MIRIRALDNDTIGSRPVVRTITINAATPTPSRTPTVTRTPTNPTPTRTGTLTQTRTRTTPTITNYADDYEDADTNQDTDKYGDGGAPDQHTRTADENGRAVSNAFADSDQDADTFSDTHAVH